MAKSIMPAASAKPPALSTDVPTSGPNAGALASAMQRVEVPSHLALNERERRDYVLVVAELDCGIDTGTGL